MASGAKQGRAKRAPAKKPARRRPETRTVPARGAKDAGARVQAGVRAEKSAARREAILAAALDEFSASGYAATRLDDVARRAGVAKGTIYLYFRDKEMLFQELIRSTLSPFVERVEAAPAIDLPLRAVVTQLTGNFVRELFSTRRKDVVRLIITEGRRFPGIAEFYYREVIARALGAIRKLVQRAIERGEISEDALVRFPQLIIAPVLVALIWEELFERFEPLDAEAMLRKHVDILFTALERRGA